jgi:hypothetical protein
MDRETPRAKDESAVIRGLKRSTRILEGVQSLSIFLMGYLAIRV